MFSCPDCQRRTETVYLCNGHFTCRICAKMSYPSQSESAHSKVKRKLRKLQAKLNPKVGFKKYINLRREESELSLIESEMSFKQSILHCEKMKEILNGLA